MAKIQMVLVAAWARIRHSCNNNIVHTIIVLASTAVGNLDSTIAKRARRLFVLPVIRQGDDLRAIL